MEHELKIKVRAAVVMEGGGTLQGFDNFYFKLDSINTCGEAPRPFKCPLCNGQTVAYKTYGGYNNQRVCLPCHERLRRAILVEIKAMLELKPVEYRLPVMLPEDRQAW